MKKFAFYCVFTVFAALAGYSSFVTDGNPWALTVIAISALLLAELDRFSEISAGSSGFKATIREAKNTILDLRKMTLINAEAQLFLLQLAGRWSGGERREKEEVRSSIESILRDAGFSDKEIAGVRAKHWDRYIKFDYVLDITCHNLVPDGGGEEVRRKWDELRRFESPATPDELEDFLNEVGDFEPNRRRLLESYRHYLKTGNHLDPEIYFSGHEIPQIVVKAPQPKASNQDETP